MANTVGSRRRAFVAVAVVAAAAATLTGVVVRRLARKHEIVEA